MVFVVEHIRKFQNASQAPTSSSKLRLAFYYKYIPFLAIEYRQVAESDHPISRYQHGNIATELNKKNHGRPEASWPIIQKHHQSN
jgi:hypothetical protein